MLVEKIQQALAFQIGSEVSCNEIGKNIGANNQTVERYIDLLEKVSVIFTLNPFSRNLPNELKKNGKSIFGTMESEMRLLRILIHILKEMIQVHYGKTSS